MENTGANYLRMNVYQQKTVHFARGLESLPHTNPHNRIAGASALLDTGSLAGDFVSANLLTKLLALSSCYAAQNPIYVCSGLDGNCYLSDKMIDLTFIFLDDNNIQQQFSKAFRVNPMAKIDVIIGRKTINQHGFLFMTPRALGFDHSQKLTNALLAATDIGSHRLMPDLINDPQPSVDSSHCSQPSQLRSPCQNGELATHTSDIGDEGHPSSHRLSTVSKKCNGSSVGCGCGRPPSETGTKNCDVLRNTASGQPCGIKIAVDEIDDDKIDTFAPFLSTITSEVTPTDPYAYMDEITFEGSEYLQNAVRQLCWENRELFSDKIAKLPADLPPYTIRARKVEWEVPENHGALRPQSAQKEVEVHHTITDLLSNGTLVRSKALYYSHPVLVQKTPGKYRMC